MNKKVIILGTAGTLKYTPWDKPDCDYWACAPVLTYADAKGRRMDAIFELHPMEYWSTIMDRLNEFEIPCYMQAVYPQIKNSIKYPLTEVQAMTNNNYLGKYFTSTISYMIALAIYNGYEAIDLYGIHMSSDEEYGDQRQACEAWLGFADARGIDIYIPPQSEIYRCNYLYGYEQEHNIVVKARHRREALENGLANLQKEMLKLQEQLDQQVGAIKDCEFWEKEYK